jgi:hypothetical protein
MLDPLQHAAQMHGRIGPHLHRIAHRGGGNPGFLASV